MAPLLLVVSAGLAAAHRGDAGQPEPAAAEQRGAPLPTAGADVADPAGVPTSADTTVASVPLRRAWLVDSQEPRYDARLAESLDAALAGVDGRVSVAVKDLGTGRGALLAPDAEMPAASLFKLTILYAVFAADVPFDEKLLITEGIKSFDLGTLELQVGETLTVAEALERMVTISDNASAILLANRVTTPRIDNDIAALGLQQTHYRADRLTTSAQDAATLLERMARGQAVSPAASADMVHLLLRQRVNDRLPSLLPPEAQVAHKTGNLPGIVNDVGIIYGPHSTLIVAALVADSHDDAAAAQGIARAAAAAYAYAETADTVADPPVPPAPARPVPAIWREPRPLPVDVMPTAALPADAVPTAGRTLPTVPPTLAPPATATEVATVAATATSAPTAVVTATPVPATVPATPPPHTATPHPAVVATPPRATPTAPATPARAAATATPAAPPTPATARPTARPAGR